MSNLQYLLGGWSSYQNLTPLDQKVFDDALSGFVGVSYKPYSVSSQIIAGTNYRFKCIAQVPPAQVIWESIVEIYAPINGTPHIIGIVRI
jgi:hypothetical protein